MPSDKARALDVHRQVPSLAMRPKGRDVAAHGLGEIAQ
jgi:hypothetical protein